MERTTRKDILNAILPAVSSFNLSELALIITDGAPAKIGSIKISVKLLIDHLSTLHCTVIGLTRERFVGIGLPL